jgi:hypothetical protein
MRCQRCLPSRPLVVQCVTNDKIPPVWPFINICRFSVLWKDRKLPYPTAASGNSY